MNNFYLVLFFTVVTIAASLTRGQPLSPTPLEALQKGLPSEIAVRPKLSLKENITTILADLEVYAQTTSALPDSNNLTPGWTVQNDRLLIETFLNHKEVFISDCCAARIQSFITNRMKQAFLDRPLELWENYFVVSKLFPEQTFWLSYYESLLSQPNMNWSPVPNQEWIATSLLPTLVASKSNSATLWNKDFLLNWLGFLKYQWTHLSSGSLPLGSKILFVTLENLDRLMEVNHSRLQTLSATDLNEIQKQYIDFLQVIIADIPQSAFLSSLTPGPAFKSILLESVAMNSFILAAQEHKVHLTLESPRVKSFLALHDSVTNWLSLSHSEGSEALRFRRAFVTAIYLRTLISLKINLTTESSVVSKGAWVSNQHFQKAFELFWYEELLKAQTEVLRLTQLTLYNLSLVDKCYRENLQTPTCQGWRESFPLQLKTMVDAEGNKKKVWELISKTPLTLPPGQILFGPNEEIHINAPEIRFQWLTRISVPSGKVEIETNKLSFAWIDVSGNNSVLGVNTSGFPGQRPWIKNSHLCSPRDYLEGVTFMNIPHKKQVSWAGFSIKNPFPKNVLVCASHAQSETKDIAGDVNQVLDLGLPPESNDSLAPIAGAPGGQIKIELTPTNSERAILLFPLLLSMGGDGSRGRDGQSSPLCQQGLYQSFKVGLSHHKEWFQHWLSEQNTSSHLSLLSKDQFGDHWYGLFEINLPRTSGSDGGKAGNGGQIFLKGESSRLEIRPNRWFLSPGVPGTGGRAGSCGPNEVHEGKLGMSAAAGAFLLLKK